METSKWISLCIFIILDCIISLQCSQQNNDTARADSDFLLVGNTLTNSSIDIFNLLSNNSHLHHEVLTLINNIPKTTVKENVVTRKVSKIPNLHPGSNKGTTVYSQTTQPEVSGTNTKYSKVITTLPQTTKTMIETTETDNNRQIMSSTKTTVNTRQVSETTGISSTKNVLGVSKNSTEVNEKITKSANVQNNQNGIKSSTLPVTLYSRESKSKAISSTKFPTTDAFTYKRVNITNSGNGNLFVSAATSFNRSITMSNKISSTKTTTGLRTSFIPKTTDLKEVSSSAQIYTRSTNAHSSSPEGVHTTTKSTKNWPKITSDSSTVNKRTKATSNVPNHLNGMNKEILDNSIVNPKSSEPGENLTKVQNLKSTEVPKTYSRGQTSTVLISKGSIKSSTSHNSTTLVKNQTKVQNITSTEIPKTDSRGQTSTVLMSKTSFNTSTSFSSTRPVSAMMERNYSVHSQKNSTSSINHHLNQSSNNRNTVTFIIPESHSLAQLSSVQTEKKEHYTSSTTSPEATVDINFQQLYNLGEDDKYWPVAMAITIGVPAIIVIGVTICVINRKRKLEKAHSSLMNGYITPPMEFDA